MVPVDLIDGEGFRANVGIIVCDMRGLLLMGGRIGQNAWQFPQGGIQSGESDEQAMFRELHEEIGLTPQDVDVLGCTRDWLRYRLPEQYIRNNVHPLCIGQKQRWYLLRLRSDDDPHFRFDHTSEPEFDEWRWADFWEPVREVVAFKRPVYLKALHELGQRAFPDGLPPYPSWWPEPGAAAARQPAVATAQGR